MTHVVVSIGSNINREANLRFAVNALKAQYGAIQISPVYESLAVGFCGSDFLNCVAGFCTDSAYLQLCNDLSAIENRAGRERQKTPYHNRTLDIDILLFGDADLRHQQHNIPREEIEHHAFVLKPLSDLYPTLRHPVSGQPYQQMLMQLEYVEQQLTRIDFNF